MVRYAACALVVSLLWPSFEARAQTPADIAREFPSTENEAVSRLAAAGPQAKRRAANPFSLETIAHTLGTRGPGDALPAIRHVIVTGDADTITRLIEQIGVYAKSRSPAELRPTALRASLEPARAAIAALPPEQAAERLRAFRTADVAFELDPLVARRRFADAMRAYPDTSAALMGQVEAIMSRPLGPDQFGALERFILAHPGTTAAARALYEVAFQFAHNAAHFEPRGSDPGPRLLSVIQIVDQLESGRYPSSEWVDRAGQLVSGFFVSADTPIPTASVDRMLDGYLDFVAARFDRLDDTAVVGSSLAYILTTKMADLHARQGDRHGGVERTLATLEARVRNARAVQLLRADYYARLAASWNADDRAFASSRADTALRALIDENDGYPSRLALATLASLEFRRRAYNDALTLYERYVARHPASPWAWVAALRIGQVHEAIGDTARAVDSYESAARAYADVPPAQVLGHVYAARAHDAADRFDDSLAALRLAADAWDADYGDTYALAAGTTIGSGGTAAPTVGRVDVSRSALDTRVAELTQTLAMPDSHVVEHGRRQFEQRQYAEAIETLATYLATHPDGAGAAEVRSLERRARFERALQQAAIWSSSRDTTAAAALLDEVIDGPADFLRSAARLARIALHAVTGDEAAARSEARHGLDELLEQQRPHERSTSSAAIEADVIEIRNLLFRPTGDLPIYQDTGRSRPMFPPALPPVAIVNAAVVVKLPGEEARSMSIIQRYTAAPDVLSLTIEEMRIIGRICDTIGGPHPGPPAPGTTGQAFDASVSAAWQTLFPLRRGFGAGWVISTFPFASQIEFLDDERTRATAVVAMGDSSATRILLEKIDGRWVAVETTGWWVA